MAKGKKRAAGEGTVRWHKSGLCEARLPIPGGGSKSFYGKTQAEAIGRRDIARVELFKGSLAFDAKNVSDRVLRPLLEAAGVPIEGVRFHDLRHTFATLSAMLGEYPQVVQRALGHSTMGQTMKTYTHILPKVQEEAAKRLGELF